METKNDKYEILRTELAFKRFKRDFEHKTNLNANSEHQTLYSLYGIKRQRLTAYDDFQLTKNELFIFNKKLSQLIDLLYSFKFNKNEIQRIYDLSVNQINNGKCLNIEK